MQLRLLLCLFTIALPVLVPTSATAQDESNGCAVTSPDETFVPPDPYPSHAADGAFWHGNRDLWTQLSNEGIWRGLPHGDDGYSNKLFLWQQGYDWRKEPKPEIVLILRRAGCKCSANDRARGHKRLLWCICNVDWGDVSN